MLRVPCLPRRGNSFIGMRDSAETSSVSTSTVMYVIRVMREKINRVIRGE